MWLPKIKIDNLVALIRIGIAQCDMRKIQTIGQALIWHTDLNYLICSPVTTHYTPRTKLQTTLNLTLTHWIKESLQPSF